MTRLFTVLLCALGATASLPSRASTPPDFSPASLNYSGSSTALVVSTISPEHTGISLHSPDITITTRTVGYENFQVFALEGEPSIPVEGSPALPQVMRFYRIPNTGSVELNLEELGFDLLQNIHPLPYHEGELQAVENPDVYNTNAWYPPQVATMSAPMQMRDFRVVMVTLYPVQVNPVTHQARVYHTMDVSIIANAQPGENEITRVRRPSGAWKSIYRSMIVNLDDSALDDATTTPGTYLIIASNNAQMVPWTDSLAVWKKRSGYDVVVDARPAWSASQMITSIRNLYATADPPLEYVTLMGAPRSSSGVPTDGTNLDHSFALGNTGDDLEDLAVGRLSGSSSAEMATIWAKLHNYEIEPWMADAQGQPDTLWFASSLLYAGIGYSSQSSISTMQWIAHQFASRTGVWNNHVVWYNGGGFNEDSLRAWLAPGAGYFLWRGDWIIGDPTIPASFIPSHKLPIVSVISESTGDFSGGTPCLSEAFLTAGTPTNPRGGVCAIGTAFNWQYGYATVLTGGLGYYLTNRGIENIGVCLMATKMLAAGLYGVDTPDGRQIVRATNLMGEPSLRPWTDVPKVLSVYHDDTLAIGTHSVFVMVTEAGTENFIPDALVVLWKGTEVYARALTDAFGTAEIPVNVATAGTMSITVSKLNCKPYLHDIACASDTGYVDLSSYYLDDDSTGGTFGNGDHEVNPGETIDIGVALRNYGTCQTLPAMQIRLVGGSAHFMVENGTSSCPALAPGDSALINPSFRILVHPQTRNGEVGRFFVHAIYNQIDTLNSVLDLTCHAGQLSNLTCENMPLFGPGRTDSLRVTVENTGVMVLPDVQERLMSLTPWITVLDSVRTLGNIRVGGFGTNGIPFVIAASPEAFRGYSAPMQAIFSSPSGYVDTLKFSVNIGQATRNDPLGPDSYGYFALDNTDTTYVMHPQYDYMDIAQVGTRLNLADPGSVAVPLPFHFKYYGQIFDTITICSAGWCAMGNRSWSNAFVNFPIPGMQAPDAMIAPYWDALATRGNTRGVWDYYQADSSRFIVQWKATGASDTTHLLNFEVILMDTFAYPTLDGNGRILIQYASVTLNLQDGSEELHNGCTIGITGLRDGEGLQCVYGTAYSAGVDTVESGRAILFATMFNADLAAEKPHAEMPQRFTLYQNYPNPFNPTTQIRFDLPKSERVQLRIFNSLGQLVSALIDEQRPAGSFTVAWNGRNASTGLYFCRLKAGSFVQTRKMLLLK